VSIDTEPPEVGARPAAPPAPAAADTRFWWLGLPAAIIGLFMTTLDQSLTGVAFGAIGSDLGASTIDTQWVTTVNRIGQAVTIPAAAWLCRRYGLRRMYVVAMVLYIVLSIGCALAPNLATLAVFRFLDGVPGGLAAIVCIGILITSVPMSKMAVAVVLLQVIVLCAPGFGPVIGGLLVLDVQWRAVFWTTVAFAVLGLVASLGLPRRPPPTAPPRFDAAGFVCLTTSVVALTLGVSKGNDWGWTSYPIVILFTVSIDAAVLFVIVERQTEHPLLNMAMFKDATFNVGMVLTAVVGIQLNTVLSFIPTFLKSVQGLSAIDAGIVMIPQALVFVTAVALANRLNRTWGIRPTTVTGLAVLGAATLMMTRITVDMPRDELATILAVRSTGLGLAFVPILSAATSRLSVNLIPDGIQFRTIVQRILGALAVTYLTEMAAHRQRQILDDQSGLLSPADAPLLYAQQQRSPDSLVALWNQLKFHGQAQSYSDVFLIVGLMTIGSIVLVFVTRWGAPPRKDDVVIEDGA
jgi:EmrB/QacA subfamily drug resistance transporter